MATKLFYRKVKMVIDHFDRFGFRGLVFLFKTLYGKKGILKVEFPEFVHPIYLRNHTSDVPTFYQCIFNEDYNINFDLEPKIIFDLGANIGLSGYFFASRYPAAKVVCVEPEASNFDLLNKNLRGFDNVQTFRNGIWYRNSKLKVVSTTGNNWDFVVTETDDEDGLPAITIEELMRMTNVDFIDILKIDIEGSELQVFNHPEVNNWLSRVGVIIIELHDKSIDGCSKAFFDALSGREYSIMQKGENIVCYMNRLSRPRKSKKLHFV